MDITKTDIKKFGYIILLYTINFAQLIICIIQLAVHAIQFVVQSQKLLITLCQCLFYFQRLFHLNIDEKHQQD